MLKSKSRVLIWVFVPVLMSVMAHAQRPHYTGALEYRLPLLRSMPPVYIGQPSDVANAYLWLDELMRTTRLVNTEKYIDSLQYGDTLKFLTKMAYKLVDDNPALEYQWEISGWPSSGHPDYPWHYKSSPAITRPEFQNRVGRVFPDSGITGYILGCDIITDVIVNDTAIREDLSDNIVPHMVIAAGSINEEIKGKKIPICPLMKAGKSHRTPQSAYVLDATIAPVDSGSCIRFEYSPEWSSGIASDELPYREPLKDSSGWWVKPGGEYILFLRLAGVGSDTAYGYFSVQPFWGVFGTQGGMYRVISGHVVDPDDDFGLGGTNLTVADWKTRLRARIYNILNP